MPPSPFPSLPPTPGDMEKSSEVIAGPPVRVLCDFPGCSACHKPSQTKHQKLQHHCRHSFCDKLGTAVSPCSLRNKSTSFSSPPTPKALVVKNCRSVLSQRHACTCVSMSDYFKNLFLVPVKSKRLKINVNAEIIRFLTFTKIISFSTKSVLCYLLLVM